jgi:hypothetical protein
MAGGPGLVRGKLNQGTGVAGEKLYCIGKSILDLVALWMGRLDTRMRLR